MAGLLVGEEIRHGEGGRASVGRMRVGRMRVGQMTVRRRHVLYMPGYDPRGVAYYYRSFRQEFARFGALHGLGTSVSRPAAPAEAAYRNWVARTTGADWQVETVYELLTWDDVVRADAGRPAWRKIAAAWMVLARYLCDGTLRRMFAAHWRFVLFFLYPYVAFLGMVAGAVLLGRAAAWVPALLPWGAAWPGAVLGGAVGLGALAACLRLSESQTYLLYLFDDGVSTDDFARGRRPDWEARLTRFAERLVAIAQAGEVDEILVVGHSSGSFMAVDVIAQALALDPALGRHGPALRLVTLGANLPLVSFNPRAGWFIERLKQVLAAPEVAWLDVQSRKDVMNFYPFDQAAGHGLAGPRLVTLGVRFRDVLLPGNYAGFRWRFFRVHFQYLMANERPASWDYFMLICGPRSISEITASFRS